MALSSELPVNLAGRKAAVLGRLLKAGFPVPPGVCVATDAFRAVSANHDALRLPDGLLEELTHAFPENTPLAVRSSAVLEDHPEASLAGRYITRLNVTGSAALEQALLDCWRSYLAAPEGGDESGMAVLIQPLLNAECAGVCFTVDPVRLRADLLLIVSGWGLGAGVVSGAIPTDTARLRRFDLGIEDFTLADKHSALHPLVSGGIGTAPIPEGQRAAACLPESWLQRVAQYGLTIEQLFGAPQDIEWAVADGKLWILQSRPVTALPEETREAVRYPIPWENEEEPRHYWWLERARDSSGSPLLPAEIDFYRINTQGGHDSVYFMGHGLTRWRKYANGRVYMAAAKSTNPPGKVRVYGAALRDLLERLAQQGITPWEQWGPEIVRATSRLAAYDPRAADGARLADHLEDAIAVATRHWMIHTMGPRPIRSPALLEHYARLAGLRSEEAAAEIPFLLAGAETIQTRLVEALYELACLALAFPEGAKSYALSTPNPAESQPVSPDLEPFALAFHNLMFVYGGRLCYRPIPGYPVDLPLPWRESPDFVWEMIAAYLPLARSGKPGPREARLEAQRAAEQRVEALCETALAAGTDPTLVQGFHRVLAYARRSAASLDEANHYIDQLSEGQYFQALLYAGRWLAARGSLPNPFDVVWLETGEVLAALRAPPDGMEEILAARMAQFAGWQELLTPACLGLPDPHLPERPAQSTIKGETRSASIELPAKTLTGEPASRGRAAGRARLISGDSLPAEITPGDILIAPYASTQLIPILPAAGALVLDYGSPGDHFAITAREFGLPAVCATLHATHRIPEGAWVIVDANSGVVTWE